MDPKVKELRLMRWKEIITACNTSGMKKEEWMMQNHINSKSFYRYQKMIREYEMEKMELPKLSEYYQIPAAIQFVDVTDVVRNADMNRQCLPAADRTAKEGLQPEIMIRAGLYNIYVGSGIHEETLATVLKVIRYA